MVEPVAPGSALLAAGFDFARPMPGGDNKRLLDAAGRKVRPFSFHVRPFWTWRVTGHGSAARAAAGFGT
jgi:hypothetical protein